MYVEYINTEDPLPSDFNSVMDRHAQTLFLTEIMRGQLSVVVHCTVNIVYYVFVCALKMLVLPAYKPYLKLHHQIKDGVVSGWTLVFLSIAITAVHDFNMSNIPKPIWFFPTETLPKCLSLFSNIFNRHTWVFNFDISFLEGKNRNHRFQYSKILKSPNRECVALHKHINIQSFCRTISTNIKYSINLAIMIGLICRVNNDSY